jgi:hypothetical protein
LEAKPLSQAMADRDTAIQRRLPLQPRGTLHAQDVDLFREQVFH